MLRSCTSRKLKAHTVRLSKYVRPAFRARFLSLNASLSTNKPGVFGLQGLHKASDWDHVSDRCIAESQPLLQQIRNDSTGHPNVLQLFDDVSDKLCQVIDTAELCRSTHPDREFVEKSDEAFSKISQFMQELNADISLYNTLLKVHKNFSSSLNDEQTAMLRSLKVDLEKGGIHLPNSQKNKVKALQNEINYLGAIFVRNVGREPVTLVMDKSHLKYIPLQLQRHAVSRFMSREVTIKADRSLMIQALKYTVNSSLREKMYKAAHSPDSKNKEVLEQLLSRRHQLSQVLGFNNYAQFSFRDRLASSHESTEFFINHLSNSIKSKAESELQLLRSTKQHFEPEIELREYDVPYYMRICRGAAEREQKELSNYFSVAGCIKGLRYLMKTVFDVDFQKLDCIRGEAWHPDVQKYELVHDIKVLGHIYLDLYPRPGKYGHAAHFTIRCARRLLSGSMQTPLVALVCNFGKGDRGEDRLSYSEVETLFHEFGHAVHSLFSTTQYQHLSGTRGALDFVEVPSHIFEYFSRDYRILCEFAAHCENGSKLPRELLDAVEHTKNMFWGMNLQTQIIYAAADLRFHVSDGQCTSKVLKEIIDKYSVLGHQEDVTLQTDLTHLYNYGCGYYSYLYARILSSQIWHSHFKHARSREDFKKAGSILKNNLLCHGGAKDPRDLLENCMNGNPSIKYFLNENGIQYEADESTKADEYIARHSFRFRL